jgi:hypothetical protein
MEISNNSDSLDDRTDNVVDRDVFDLPPIPDELEYLVEPGIHYGRKYQFDNDVQCFLENAEESDLESLATLAERVRLSGDYPHFLQWSREVDYVLEHIVDQRYPYKIEISEQQRNVYLRLVNPDLAERWKDKCVRHSAEANDNSDLAERRRAMRMHLLTKANDKVHHMDIYYIFGLMDACDMEFE